MNKRQRKKLSREKCPRCKDTMGIWSLRKLPTGRWVSDFCCCTTCGHGYPPEKQAEVREIRRKIEADLEKGRYPWLREENDADVRKTS